MGRADLPQKTKEKKGRKEGKRNKGGSGVLTVVCHRMIALNYDYPY